MNPQTKSNTGTTLAIILVILIAVAAGAYFLDSKKGDGTKLGNAVEEFQDNAEQGRIGEGVEEGSEELQDRTTGEKIGDAIEDTGRDIQDAASGNE